MQQLAELLNEGFSVVEALEFLKIIDQPRLLMYEEILNQLEAGELFPLTLVKYGFSKRIVSQLSLSFFHGNFSDTLLFCAMDLSTHQKQWDKFKQIAAYPLLLILIALCMLLAIRSFLLPVIQETEIAINNGMEGLFFFLTYLPQIICILLLLFVTTIFMLKRHTHSLTAYARACFYSRIPFIGNWLKKYYSFIFSREIGFFFSNGHSISQTLQFIQEHSHDSLLNETSKRIENELRSGLSFPQVVEGIPIFTTEMTWLIAYGEKTSQLGLKLKLFSENVYRQMIQKTERSIQAVQPLLFSLIGLIIVLIYLILMLPMLDMMKGVF